MEHLSTSYLYAVQKIPGETRVEKFKEIGRIVKRIINIVQEESGFTNAVSAENVPSALVPLIKVLVGVKIKSHAFIIEALKSDDCYLTVEALRARWFYDGSNESITNYKYFAHAVLPYVSMSTRREIVKKLAVCLGNNHTTLAENFFDGFVIDYGVQEATNFLPACRSEFIYDAIVKHKIVLSNKLLRILYKKYPDLALRYLKFTNPYERRDEIGRAMFRLIDVNEYERFIPLLVTKHPESFVSMQEICHTSASLGNRRAKMFLKNAKDILIKKPRDIIELMPIKLVYDSLKQEEFETMFGNILEDRWDMFSIDDMLNYLEYYPKDKRATLLRSKVKEKYGHDLYDKVEKLTAKFLLLLPKEERYALARKIVEVRHKMEVPDPETSWWCFLPAEEAIPVLKVQIAKNWKLNKRQKMFSQLIYVCKLNESKEALLDVLRYVDETYKNERADVICNMLDRITQEFDISSFEQEYWTHLFNIIKRIKLKKENARDYWVLIKILKKNVHYCDKHGLPSDEIIEHIVRLFLEGRVGVSWKLLEDEAEFERRYLDACFNHNYWLNMNYKKNAVEGIYNFNERHVTADNSVARLSIRDYPHLKNIVEKTLKCVQNEGCSWVVYTKEKLKKHEPELYASWFPEDEEEDAQSETLDDDLSIEEEKSGSTGTITPATAAASSGPAAEPKPAKIIYLTEAIIALKRNYPEIKENWQLYYECCKSEVGSKKRRRVKHFLKALRWYQEVPVKFAERALEERNFNVMGYLFDGPSFSRVALTFLPSETEENHNASYLNAVHITSAMKNASTPISVELVEQYLGSHYMYSFKNYINDGLKMWSYVAYRTSSDRMIQLSRNLSRDRLFLKRHAMRLMNAMASRADLVRFFAELWRDERHPMIREILACKIGKLFSKRPNQDTWQLVNSCIDDLAIGEDEDLEFLVGYKPLPIEFASAYVERILGKLHAFVEQGVSKQHAAKFLDQLLENLKPDSRDYLSEQVCRDILQFYVQNMDVEFNNVDRFIVKIYLSATSPHFEERLRYLMTLLGEQSQHWYALSMEKRKHTANLVDNFTHTVVYQVQKFKGNFRLVSSLAEIFAVKFPAHQHAWSHVMLFLCTEYMRTEPSFKDFGVQVADKVGALVERYAPEYFMQIVELVREFIYNFSFYEYATTIKNRLNFLEGLIERKNNNGLVIAAKLLNQKIVSEYNYQHCKILQQLSEINNPIVQSFL